MAYASRAGRARTSSKNPQAHAICDRCGFRYNHVDLQWQFDWAGASLINKRILVCDTCNDVPQEQLRAIIVPADPVPILNPRIQDFVTAETNTRATSGQNTVDPRTGIPVVNPHHAEQQGSRDAANWRASGRPQSRTRHRSDCTGQPWWQ